MAPTFVLLAAILAAGALPSRAMAQDAARAPLDRVMEAIDGASNSAGRLLRGAGAMLFAEAPSHYLPERLAESDLAFVAAMESAGLTFAEIRTGGGVLPDASYRFLASREPTAHDLSRARSQLAQHRGRHDGLRAMAQQRILQTVIDAAEANSFIITELEITVRPWPSIRYVMAARQRPLDDPQRRLLEALRGVPPAN